MSARHTEGWRRSGAQPHLLAMLMVGAIATVAEAQPPVTGPAKPTSDASATTESESRVKARQAFLRGTDLVRDAHWAEALGAFEEAQAALPHAITIFNIGACERALGNYTRARRAFEAALAESRSKRTELPPELVDDANAFLAEIERTLARVTVSAAPRASLLLDGRPLLLSADSKKDGDDLPGPRVSKLESVAPSPPVLVAGILPPGEGEAPPTKTFVIEMNPGPHVLTFVRRGFSDAIIRKTFASGENPPLDLTLDELPATVSVSANERNALVTVDGKDLGPVPIAIQRPAGQHKIRVEKRGFVTYESLFALKAGEQTNLRAKLAKRDQPIVEKWWFWTLTSAALTGVAVGTYFAARPAPQRPTVGGGSLGWRVDIP